MRCCLFCLLFLLCISCNKRTEYPCQIIENENIDTYPMVELIADTLAWQDSTLLDPYRMWIQDSLLILQDYIGKEEGMDYSIQILSYDMALSN